MITDLRAMSWQLVTFYRLEDAENVCFVNQVKMKASVSITKSRQIRDMHAAMGVARKQEIRDYICEAHINHIEFDPVYL